MDLLSEKITTLSQRALILSGIILFPLLAFHAQQSAVTYYDWLFVIVASFAMTLFLIIGLIYFLE